VFTQRQKIKSDVCRTEFITTEVGFRRSWWLAKVCHRMEKQRSFIDPQKTKESQSLTFWRHPSGKNAAVHIQTIISSLWKTARRHRYQRQKTLYCSGKDVYQLWQSRMEDLFSTFSADQLTDYCNVACIVPIWATTSIMNRLQTLFYDVKRYLVYIMANTEVF